MAPASNWPYEAQIVGAFVYELGHRGGKAGTRVTVDLLAHSPADATLGDLLVHAQRAFLLEFKSAAKYVTDELEKPRRKAFLARLGRDGELDALSRRGHFVMYPEPQSEKGVIQIEVLPYADVSLHWRLSPSGNLATDVTDAIAGSGKLELGFSRAELVTYVNALAKPDADSDARARELEPALEALQADADDVDAESDATEASSLVFFAEDSRTVAVTLWPGAIHTLCQRVEFQKLRAGLRATRRVSRSARTDSASVPGDATLKTQLEHGSKASSPVTPKPKGIHR